MGVTSTPIHEHKPANLCPRRTGAEGFCHRLKCSSSLVMFAETESRRNATSLPEVDGGVDLRPIHLYRGCLNSSRNDSTSLGSAEPKLRDLRSGSADR